MGAAFRSRSGPVLAAAAVAALVSASGALAATGALTYRGCISGETESGPAGSGACAAIPTATSFGHDSGLRGLASVALSADGRSLYIASGGDAAIARFKRNPKTGALTYRGCITGETESGPAGSGACATIPAVVDGGDDSGLVDPASVAVSADGRSLYAASRGDDAIVRFKRNRKTGALAYKDCITGETESGPAGSGACAVIPADTAGGINSGLDNPVAVALSADGRSLYTASEDDDAIARFKRNPKTGALAYGGCITGRTQAGPAGSGACAAIPAAAAGGDDSGLSAPSSVAVSADGRALYVASAFDHAIARFKRNPKTGALAYGGCISGETGSGPAGTGACMAIPAAGSFGESSGLRGLASVALSADGRSLYAASAFDAAIARFKRSPKTGALTYRGCISGETESGPAGSGACAAIPAAGSFGFDSGLDFLSSLALSADGRSLYAASRGDAAIARFKRSPKTGALTYRGCISGETESGPAGSGACAAIPAAGPLGDNSGLEFLSSLALSADGRSLYAASGGAAAAIARFKRARG